MNNEARIVADEKNNKQLQLEVATLIEDEKRREVLIYTALKSVMAIEWDVAHMAASKIDVMYEAIKAEDDPPLYSSNGRDKVASESPVEVENVGDEEITGEAV